MPVDVRHQTTGMLPSQIFAATHHGAQALEALEGLLLAPEQAAKEAGLSPLERSAKGRYSGRWERGGTGSPKRGGTPGRKGQGKSDAAKSLTSMQNSPVHGGPKSPTKGGVCRV